MAEEFTPLVQLLALKEALDALAQGTTIPIRLNPNAGQVETHRTFMSHLRATMWRESL